MQNNNRILMDAKQQIKALYDRFIELHPNSLEPFTPSLENMQRWQWHIREASGRPEHETMEVKNTDNAERIAKSRSFSTFAQMPTYMQDRYMQIASLFPGVQFYACGSRVNGEYIETWSGSGIKKLRGTLNKPDKKESDYDFCIDIPAHIDKKGEGDFLNIVKDSAPKWSDLMRTGIPPNEKIPIPMWDFQRLPKSEHQNVIILFDSQNWGELMQIHNKYALSHNVYCCDEKPVIRYFDWAIRNGIIQNEQESEKEAAKLD